MEGLACNTHALTPEQRQERVELAKLIHTQTQELRELSDGYAFRLPSSSALFLELAEFVHLERHCCPFFKFVLELQANEGPIWLTITGPEGSKEFMKTEVGLL
jgi:CHASE1-domain containing sensor protein